MRPNDHLGALRGLVEPCSALRIKEPYHTISGRLKLWEQEGGFAASVIEITPRGGVPIPLDRWIAELCGVGIGSRGAPGNADCGEVTIVLLRCEDD